MATLNNSTTYLTDLIGAGNDALNNLYYVEFSGEAVTNNKLGDSRPITYRCDSFSFAPPTHGASDINFMTETLSVPNTTFDIDKTFNLKIRLDSEYQIYKDLLTLQSRHLNENDSVATTDIDNEFNVCVFVAKNSTSTTETADLSHDGDSNWVKMFEFKYCWISKVTPPSFDYNSSDAQSVDVTIKFYDYAGPFTE